MSVEIIETATQELTDAMERLIPQLSSSSPALTPEETTRFVSQPSVKLFVFRTDNEDGTPGTIEGMLTLVLFHIPTGLRAWIEDVVVSEETRGQGAGRKLTEAALDYAREAGARTVDLTSRPSREAANRLYQRCGFEKRQTNVYRYRM
ncbi:MAG: GNAT family N-acetyltransferase [Actinomycetaceae bacterium]|nr:GNAT family N-acetyltransferase [Actinomycetaceae bacterium]